MKRRYLVTLVAVLLILVQLPYAWLLWFQPKAEPPKSAPLGYLRPNLQKTADINRFNPNPTQLILHWDGDRIT